MSLSLINPFSQDFFLWQDYKQACFITDENNEISIRNVFMGDYTTVRSPPTKEAVRNFKIASVARIVLETLAIALVAAVVTLAVLEFYPAAIAVGSAAALCILLTFGAKYKIRQTEEDNIYDVSADYYRDRNNDEKKAFLS